jgi:predicted lipid-binding transport protein (Tim44 family)
MPAPRTILPMITLVTIVHVSPAAAFQPAPAEPYPEARQGFDLMPGDCGGATRAHQAIGGLIGGVVGGLIASGIGKGGGKTAATIGGTVLGAVGGAMLGGKVAEGSPQCLPELAPADQPRAGSLL